MASAQNPVRTLIVSVAKAGHVSQCVALCEAAGWTSDETILIPAPGRMTAGWERLRLTIRRRIATWRATPRRRGPGLLRIAASGAAAEPVIAAYRALYGDDLFAAFSGRPQRRDPVFDLALVPRHSLEPGERVEDFALPAARRCILRRGVPIRRIDAATARPRSGTLAMIGGVNKAYEIDAGRIVEQLRSLSERGGGPIAVAFSRRTPGSVEERLRHDLAGAARFIDRSDRGGFEQAMAEAAAFVVTPDSLTMACEAAATRRPTRIFDLVCFAPQSSTARCVDDLLAGGEIALAPDGEPRGARCDAFDPPPGFVEAYQGWAAARGV